MERVKDKWRLKWDAELKAASEAMPRYVSPSGKNFSADLGGNESYCAYSAVGTAYREKDYEGLQALVKAWGKVDYIAFRDVTTDAGYDGDMRALEILMADGHEREWGLALTGALVHRHDEAVEFILKKMGFEAAEGAIGHELLGKGAECAEVALGFLTRRGQKK